MKIVYDMRTGEIVGHAAEPQSGSAGESRSRTAPSVPETALQLAEYRWSEQHPIAPPKFLACYFDEAGE